LNADIFIVEVETYHVADRGESENVHRLNKKQLAERRVVHIDIANDPVSINLTTSVLFNNSSL
jgi:hypothetical protein